MAITEDPINMYEFKELNKECPFSIVHEKLSSVPWHRHDYVEISFVVGGSGIHLVNDWSAPLSRGSMFIILPYQIHRYLADGGELDMFTCAMDIGACFSGDEIGQSVHEILFRDASLSNHIHVSEDDYGILRSLLENMLCNFADLMLPHRRSLLHLQFNELLLRFDGLRSRAENAPVPRVHSEPAVGRRSTMTWNILHYIHMHYNENITLAALSTRFSLSPQYVSTLINRELGESLRSLLNRLRIEYAQSLLVTTDLSITQIAMDVGFESMGSFFRAFRQFVGQKPSDFRKNNQTSIPLL